MIGSLRQADNNANTESHHPGVHSAVHRGRLIGEHETCFLTGTSALSLAFSGLSFRSLAHVPSSTAPKMPRNSALAKSRGVEVCA